MSAVTLAEQLSELERIIAGSPDAAVPRAQRARVLTQLGRTEEALAGYDAALALDPTFVDAWFNKANLLLASGRLEDALAGYRRVCELSPDDAGALNNMGVALFRMERYQEALECYAKAITRVPDYAEAYTNRGNALLELGFHDEAVASHERALQINPTHARALVNLGNARQEMGAHEEALRTYERALAVDPVSAEALNGAAVALLALDRPDAALAACERALQVRPEFVEAMANKGRILTALERHDEALAVFTQAYGLLSGATQAFDVAVALQNLSRHQEALQYFERALVQRPDYVEALVNRGNSLQAVNRHAAAVRSYQRAIELRPRNADAHWNEGLARLALGDYRGGWDKYEWRWKSQSLGRGRPPVEAPVWTGAEPLEGKRLLLFQEQGFGDAIQFVRFAGAVAQRAREVFVACHPSLTRLFDTATGVAGAIDDPAGLQPDLQISLMSLPAALRTTLRSLPQPPYLHAADAEAAEWRQRFADRAGQRRIGFVWAGNPDFQDAARKRCAIEAWAPLFAVPDTLWVSLQKTASAADRRYLRAQENVVDVGEDLTDFAATAACIEALDLVVTVDTAVAHLAGALNKPVMVLLPHSADWRWLVGRGDSPWYPSAQLFRQAAPGDWSDAIGAVGGELRLLPWPRGGAPGSGR